MQRRLAAIMAADVVAYSRLMGEDEAGTLAQLKAHREELIDPKIAEHHGRIVKLMGDGILAEFPSAVEAVQSAVEIQQGLGQRNAAVSEERRIAYRIGINIGDIIVEDDDIYGNGVNVAARLEALAEPGGICLSRTVYEHIKGKVDLGFEETGEQEVKNIPEPVRVYRWIAAIASTPDTAAAVGALPLPDKPSVAVLPFVNMSGDPEQESLSDGIIEDIITELSRFRSLFVIARNSSFIFKGQAVDAIEVGQKLGVRYVVEGGVRSAGSRIRVTVQLVEAATGNHLWAERYDHDLEDVFAVQDELVRKIVATVSGRVDYAGRKRAKRLSASDLQAFDLFLRAIESFNRYTKEDNARAREHLERAVELDPYSSQAYLMLGVVHRLNWKAHWVEDREKSLAIAYDCAKKAVALDDTDGDAYSSLGMCHTYHRQYDDARQCFQRALMLNPNNSITLGDFGYYLTAVGRIDEALTNLDESARINPLQPEWFNWLMGIVLFTARRYDEAITVLRTIESPINEVRGWLAVSYAGAGRLDEARAMLEEFLRVAEEDMAVFPGRKLAAWEPFWHGAIEYQNDADFEHLYDSLRKAGLED